MWLAHRQRGYGSSLDWDMAYRCVNIDAYIIASQVAFIFLNVTVFIGLYVIIIYLYIWLLI